MRVGFDVTPLAGGTRTGVGVAVAATLAALERRDDCAPLPYALSWRARDARDDLPPLTRFPPIPARLLLRAWSRADFPVIDRWIGRPDVIHATNYLAPPSRTPTVVTVHDCWFIRHPDQVAPDVRAYEKVLRRAVRRGAWVHAVSAHGARDAIELLDVPEARVRVIPWGVPAVVPPAVAPPEVRPLLDGPPFVLALGALEPRKNLATLVRAFAQVPDARLVIAGPDGRDTETVAREIAALGAEARARVVRLGAVTDQAAGALLGGAALLAFPSLDEGFGFPVLEAMQVGTPVVAADAGAIPEVAGDAAVLVDPHDPAALAAAINSVLHDDERRRHGIDAGRARAAEFTWARTAEGLVSLYRESRA